MSTEGQAAKDKVEGKIHEVKGAVTGNKAEEVKGKLQGAKGTVEEKKADKNASSL